MRAASTEFWDVMSTARTIRRFTDDPVDDLNLDHWDAPADVLLAAQNSAIGD